MRSTCVTELDELRSEVAARIEPLVGDGGEASFEERCRLYLQALRWPSGTCCPRCSEDYRLLWLDSRCAWHCSRCRYQFSVTAGTLFHRTHLPVWKWLVAVHLMLDSPEGISAAELSRQLGGSYKTSWFAAHRIRAAMRGSGHEPFRSLRVADLERRAAQAAAIESPLTDEAGGAELPVEPRLADRTQLARLLAGPHHRVSAKHVPGYLDERRWRHAHRSNPHAFRDTIRALLRGENLSYVQLVAGR